VRGSGSGSLLRRVEAEEVAEPEVLLLTEILTSFEQPAGLL